MKMFKNESYEILSKWLTSMFPTSIIRFEDKRIEVYEVEDGYSIGYRMAYCIIPCSVECGEELSECYKNVGQCLICCVENGFIPTYIAVPEVCPRMKRLERTLGAINLPIGLITIDRSGEVKVTVKPHVP